MSIRKQIDYRKKTKKSHWKSRFAIKNFVNKN